MKQEAILGGLLAISLVGSYLTWTAPDDAGKATDVVLLRSTVDSLDAITFEDDESTIAVTRPDDAHGAYIWIEQTERKEVPIEGAEPEGPAEPPEPADDGDDPPEEPEVPTEVVETSVAFLGNEQALEAWEGFAPLTALRELPEPSEGGLEAYELDESSATITVQDGGRTHTIELGGEAYGTRDRYVRVDGALYLIDDAKLRPLQFAKTRLVERRLHPLAEGDIASVSLARGADQRTIVQRNADDRTKAYWADADSPDTRDVEAGTWLGKLFRLRSRGFTAEADLPDGLQPSFSFQVTGEDDTWTVQIHRTTGDEEAWYAKADFTRSWVELTKSLAQEAADDLDTLFDDIVPEDDALDDGEGEQDGAEPADDEAELDAE